MKMRGVGAFLIFVCLLSMFVSYRGTANAQEADCDGDPNTFDITVNWYDADGVITQSGCSFPIVNGQCPPGMVPEYASSPGWDQDGCFYTREELNDTPDCNGDGVITPDDMADDSQTCPEMAAPVVDEAEINEPPILSAVDAELPLITESDDVASASAENAYGVTQFPNTGAGLTAGGFTGKLKLLIEVTVSAAIIGFMMWIWANRTEIQRNSWNRY